MQFDLAKNVANLAQLIGLGHDFRGVQYNRSVPGGLTVGSSWLCQSLQIGDSKGPSALGLLDAGLIDTGLRGTELTTSFIILAYGAIQIQIQSIKNAELKVQGTHLAGRCK